MMALSLLWRHLYLEPSQSVQYFAEQFSFTTRCVLNGVASYEKSEQVQQANVFKCQRLTFHFSTYRPNSFKDLSHHTLVRLLERIDCCDRCIGGQNNTAIKQFFLVTTFVTMSKLLTPNVHCWSRKILVTIHWMHFRLIDICAKFFCPQKTN